MDTRRQKKISRLIQETSAEIFQRGGGHLFPSHVLVSVTSVAVTPDLSIARLYLSIFNAANAQEIMEGLHEHLNEIRYQLGNALRHHLRKVPALELYLDDSLEQADRIDDLFRKIKKEERGED